MKFFYAILIALLVAQPTVEWVEVVKQKRYSFSNNVVFVVDSSSSIYNSDNMNLKLRTAWYRVFKSIRSDDVYFAVYSFNNDNGYIFRPWESIGLDTWREQLKDAFIWTRSNQGMFSYGQVCLSKAIKERNPLNLNPTMRDALTIVLITDGGLTEAARYGTKKGFAAGEGGSYEPIYQAIEDAQLWRKQNGLSQATICTVGLQNLYKWSLSVKRPDDECQKFLKYIGTRYKGGYFLVRNKVTK